MKTIALASAAVVVTLAGTAVATTVLNTDAPANTSGPSAPAGQAASDELQQLADDIYQSFSGTRHERDAGAVLAAYALNGRQAECMHRSGFPGWDWSLPRTTNPQNHGLEESLFFQAPLRTPFAEMKMTVSPMLKADQAAMAADASEREMHVGLRERWWELMADLDDRLGDRDAGVDEVRSAIEEFASRNATEIAAARKAWDDTVDRARVLGYTGQFESLVK